MKKVLVVDDNELVRRITDIYLSERGYEVVSCNSPFGVLNKVKEHSPDFILMDLNMPGLSGQRLAELVSKTRIENGFKLLVFSSEDESVQSELVEKGYADGYFIKRNSLEGLDDKLRELSDSRDECCVSDH